MRTGRSALTYDNLRPSAVDILEYAIGDLSIRRPPVWNSGRRKTQITISGTTGAMSDIKDQISILGKVVSCLLTRGFVHFLDKEEHLRRELSKISLNLSSQTRRGTKTKESNTDSGSEKVIYLFQLPPRRSI